MITIKRAGAILAHVSPSELTPTARSSGDFDPHFLCLRLLRERLDQEFLKGGARLDAMVLAPHECSLFEAGFRESWHTLWSVRSADDAPKEYTDTLHWDSELSILSKLGCW